MKVVVTENRAPLLVFESEDCAQKVYDVLPNKEEYMFICWNGHNNALIQRKDFSKLYYGV